MFQHLLRAAGDETNGGGGGEAEEVGRGGERFGIKVVGF